jgi:hypothetical protein
MTATLLIAGTVYLALGVMLAASCRPWYRCCRSRLQATAKFIWLTAFWLPIVGYELLGGGL